MPSSNKQRNILITGLCIAVLLMGIVYAFFQTNLNIDGTATITSKWDVKITNIVSKNIVGTASNNGDPAFTGTSATFKTNLESPGDSIEYDITVANNGNLDAQLDDIVLIDSNNSAIEFSTRGLKKGDIINAGTSSTLNVKVAYSDSVNTDPATKESNLTVTLDYSQYTE